MLEGYIQMPEDIFLHLDRDLRFYKRINILLLGVCCALGYLLWAGKESTKEKAG